jgi:hypothetical protein
MVYATVLLLGGCVMIGYVVYHLVRIRSGHKPSYDEIGCAVACVVVIGLLVTVFVLVHGGDASLRR